MDVRSTRPRLLVLVLVVALTTSCCGASSATSATAAQPDVQEGERTNVDGTPCVGLNEIEPTPVGAGPEALEAQVPLCVEDFLASELPVLGEATYPTSETYPCVEFEGILEWDQYTTRQHLESERELGDRIVAWADVVIDELGVAPSLDWGPIAVDLQSAKAAGDGVLPEEAYGYDLLLAAMELAHGDPVRLGIGEHDEILQARVFVSETTGWQPVLDCPNRRYPPIRELLDRLDVPDSLRAANDMLLTLNGHPEAAPLDEAVYEDAIEQLRAVEERTIVVELAVPETWLAGDEPFAVCASGLDGIRCSSSAAFERSTPTGQVAMTSVTVFAADGHFEILLPPNVPDATVFDGTHVPGELRFLGHVETDGRENAVLRVTVDTDLGPVELASNTEPTAEGVVELTVEELPDS